MTPTLPQSPYVPDASYTPSGPWVPRVPASPQYTSDTTDVAWHPQNGSLHHLGAPMSPDSPIPLLVPQYLESLLVQNGHCSSLLLKFHIFSLMANLSSSLPPQIETVTDGRWCIYVFNERPLEIVGRIGNLSTYSHCQFKTVTVQVNSSSFTCSVLWWTWAQVNPPQNWVQIFRWCL